MDDKYRSDYELSEQDFYPPTDNRVWKSNVKDIIDGDNFEDYCEYIFNLLEEENIAKSNNYVLDSAKKLRLLGGKRVVFHPASQGKLERSEAVALCRKRLENLAKIIKDNGLDDLYFCPETMGKLGQIGTIEEITEFCSVADFYIPTVDFGHVNARELGSLKTTEDFYNRLKYMVDRLGYEKMKHFHVHFSKIEYSAKGEVRHLTFEDQSYGPDFMPMIEAIKQLNLYPYVICESAGTQDVDALSLKQAYFSK